MILTELRHLLSVLRGRVQLDKPAFCDRCPATATHLPSRQAETYGLVGEAACRRCPTGILRPAAVSHIARASAYYITHGDQP